MPHEILDISQVSRYLNLDEREVAKLVSRGKIPCHRRGQAFMFRKSEVDHWVELQLHELPDDRLARIEEGVRLHHGMGSSAAFISRMIPSGGVSVPLGSRTARSVLRDLVALADSCGLVYGREELLKALQDREELCSTAILPQTALPHPHHPLPYDISESFIIVGKSEAGVPFNAADGSLTRLFFLICCKDDRTHLHVLARLGRMLQEPESVERLLLCEDSAALRNEIEELETRVAS